MVEQSVLHPFAKYVGIVKDADGKEAGVITYSVRNDGTVGGFLILGSKPDIFSTGFSGQVEDGGTFFAEGGPNTRRTRDKKGNVVGVFELSAQIRASAAGKEVTGKIDAQVNGVLNEYTYSATSKQFAVERRDGRDVLVDEKGQIAGQDATDFAGMDSGSIMDWVESAREEAMSYWKMIPGWGRVLGLGAALVWFVKWLMDWGGGGKKGRRRKRKRRKR